MGITDTTVITRAITIAAVKEEPSEADQCITATEDQIRATTEVQQQDQVTIPAQEEAQPAQNPVRLLV
jgi:hypothetical protein